jgi:hypothetical protein
MSTTRPRPRVPSVAVVLPRAALTPSRGDDAAVLGTRIATVATWRRGAWIAVALTPTATAGLLGAPAASLGAALPAAALLVALVTELVARRAVRTGAMHPGVTAVPAVARERARLSGAAHRRRLASELRRMAGSDGGRIVPRERVAAARQALLEVADAAEAADRADPALLAEIRALLRDGTRSALLNAEIPASELHETLRRVRFRLLTESGPCDRRGAGTAS